ncbi:EamA family transporter [Bacillus sp. HSf4]|uniref:EamA family transporter n=2 Tax=Bacillus TaxID=1386 RepID=UPI00240A2D74|nr:EamA family transporter [Bacillus sp. HSf4]WFA06359.1 EamA family transporter [Bacillus sp. HSf4]
MFLALEYAIYRIWERVDDMKAKHFKGIMMVLAGATLWGLSGSAAQYLFEQGAVGAGALVSVRLLASGVILLLYVAVKNSSSHVFRIWKKKSSASSILIFSIFGMLAVQYTFFSSIEGGNAAAAAVLQYLAPFFVLIYIYIKKEASPKLKDVMLAFAALAGVFLLLTGGRPDSLYVPLPSVIWGVLSGAALAFYTVYAGALIQAFGALTVTGWGMLIGGLGISVVFPPFQFDPSAIGIGEGMAVLFVVLCGTALAFALYIGSLSYLSPKETSCLSCAEPLAAVLSSAVWLDVPFNAVQGAGTIMIIMTVIWLSLSREGKTKTDITDFESPF